MKKKRSRRRRWLISYRLQLVFLTHSKGFNLIELMIAVAIVSLLAAIAVPNFTEFAIRAKHSEAKMNLAAIYSAEKAFFAEFQSYTSRLDAINFQPEGSYRFNIGFSNSFSPAIPFAPQGTPGCTSICPVGSCPPQYTTWSCLPEGLNGLDGSGSSRVTPTTFQVEAHAHFSPEPEDWYTWTIDHNKSLRQIIPAN